ncbi:ribosome maturation factor RimM [uncultured Litoreibacter sp.]|uniref:ribosome maturation factor RimM n=1 Tax=uncultured Litoreibacter sp. TaxID=1392394 RepID=UPI0026322FA9|nr:ribosome maturation factor RimM [uncultured Litoreibacter sp.]
MNKDQIVLGVIAGAFGVKGEVRLKSFCAEPEDIANYSPLRTEKGDEYTLKITRQVKNGFAARLSGIRFKDEADKLRGVKLYADRSLLPSLPDDEYYYTDLIGLDVVDTGGEKIGKIAAVENHGAGDILDIRGAGLNGSLLLAFTQDAVPTVDLASGRVVIDPPEEISGKET